MSALGLIILLSVAFLGGLFYGVYIALRKKQSWWADKVIGIVRRNTSIGNK